jgi:hypothetical protein
MNTLVFLREDIALVLLMLMLLLLLLFLLKLNKAESSRTIGGAAQECMTSAFVSVSALDGGCGQVHTDATSRLVPTA